MFIIKHVVNVSLSYQIATEHIFVHSEDTNVSCKFYTPTHSRCMLNIPVCTEFLPNRPHHESMGYGKRLKRTMIITKKYELKQ